MDERKLIKNIKGLKQIKPNKDWVFFTKERILGDFEDSPQKETVSSLGWLFTPFQRPALVVRPLIAGVLVFAGVFVYLYYSQVSQLVQLARLPFISEKQGETEIMAASLGEIQVSLQAISSSLNNLKNSKNPNQALAVTEVIKATANRGKEMVGQIKRQSPSKKVLASLNGIEKTFKELGEISFNIQKEMLEQAFEDLADRTLSEEDQARLEKALEYYNEGKYTEAMILVQRIGQ